MPEIDAHNALRFADKLRRLAERTSFRFEETEISITISIGVATFGPAVADTQQFVKLADDRLYAAKAAGRNQVVGG